MFPYGRRFRLSALIDAQSDAKPCLKFASFVRSPHSLPRGIGEVIGMSQLNDSSVENETQHGFGLNEETMRVIREVMRDDYGQATAQDDQYVSPQPKMRHRLFSKLKIPQITPRRAAIVLIMVTVFLKPWFFPTVFLWMALFVAFFLLVFGRDRCGRVLSKAWGLYASRRPEKAEKIRARVDARLSRLQARLERLPLPSRIDLPRWQSKDMDLAADYAYANRMDRIAQEQQSKPYSG